MVIKEQHGTAYVERIPGYGWYIASIIVDTGHQRQGIGTQLMNRIVDKCSTRPIYLYASPEFGTDIKTLKRFYRKFGFKPLTRTELRQLDIFPLKANMVLY